MTKIAVIYYSATGTTQKLAQSIIKGISSQTSVEIKDIKIAETDIIEGRYKNQDILNSLKSVQAIIFGSPTYMGCVSAQLKSFMDATGDIWSKQIWRDKLAAGFTIGTNLCGDQLNTLQTLQTFSNQHGMLWVSLDIPGNNDSRGRNQLGAQSGLVAHSKNGIVNDKDLETAYYLGQRVTSLTKQLNDD